MKKLILNQLYLILTVLDVLNLLQFPINVDLNMDLNILTRLGNIIF